MILKIGLAYVISLFYFFVEDRRILQEEVEYNCILEMDEDEYEMLSEDRKIGFNKMLVEAKKIRILKLV